MPESGVTKHNYLFCQFVNPARGHEGDRCDCFDTPSQRRATLAKQRLARLRAKREINRASTSNDTESAVASDPAVTVSPTSAAAAATFRYQVTKSPSPTGPRRAQQTTRSQHFSALALRPSAALNFPSIFWSSFRHSDATGRPLSHLVPACPTLVLLLAAAHTATSGKLFHCACTNSDDEVDQAHGTSHHVSLLFANLPQHQQIPSPPLQRALKSSADVHSVSCRRKSD